jgi:hypothetical protein
MAFPAFPLRAFLLPASLFLVLLHQAAQGLLLILGSDGLGHGRGDSVLLRIVRSLLPLVGALGGGDRSRTFDCDFLTSHRGWWAGYPRQIQEANTSTKL